MSITDKISKTIDEAYAKGRLAERKRILGLEVMRDEKGGYDYLVSEELADRRNALRAEIREAIGDSDGS